MFRFSRIFFLTLFLAAGLNGFAGPKLKLLLRNIEALKGATLLVPPILADPQKMKKFQESGDNAGLAEYLANVAQANRNMEVFLKSDFDFCKVKLLFDEPKVQTYDQYFQYLKSFKPGEFYVLQFGHAVQYVSGTYKRIKPYDRDYLGIYETDCSTKIYINTGKLSRMHQDHYATSIMENLQFSLNNYYKMAENKRKKGKLRGKKTKTNAIDPVDPKYSTSIDESMVWVQKVRLDNDTDSLRFLDHYWHTGQSLKPVLLYRYFGGKAKMMESELSSEKMEAENEIRGRMGIPIESGNTVRFRADLSVAPGTRMQLGKASPFPVDRPLLPGGADLILIPGGLRTGWILKITDLKDSKEYSWEEFQKAFPGE